MPNHSSTEEKLRGFGDKFRDISAIDARLNELDQEKQQLMALREERQKSGSAAPISDSFSPDQKIAIFGSLLRGRTDILPIAGKTSKDEAVIL